MADQIITYSTTTSGEGRAAEKTTKEITMERRDLSGPGWTPRQVDLYRVLEQVEDMHGPFDKGTGPNGVHYVDAESNPFISEGIACRNCAFFQGGGGCELLADTERVEPDAACKFWLVPGDLITSYDPADDTALPEIDPIDVEMTDEELSGYGQPDDEEESRALRAEHRYTGPALVALIGPPGAGKTTWTQREMPSATRVSLEAIRRGQDPADIIRTAVEETFMGLRMGEVVVFDATLINPVFRKRIRAIGRAVGAPVHAVIFRTPLEKLLAAQEGRTAPVPDERVRELHQAFEDQLASIPGEGWASVITVSREGSEERSQPVEFAELRERLAGEARSLDCAMTEARAIPAEGGGYVIEGHAAVFDSHSYPLPDGRGGSFVEVVKRGAFRRALQAPEGPTVALMNHDQNLILGTTENGSLQLWEDPKGLRIRLQVAPTSYAEDLRVLMERGDVSGMSFGFTVESDRWWQDGEGRTRRDIQRIGRLTDVSVVVSPAYGASSAEITSRGAETSHEEATASDATGGPSAAASASTRRLRLRLMEMDAAPTTNDEE